MSLGGVHTVQSHVVHSAKIPFEVADAYVLPPTVCAACNFQLSDCDFNRFSHWRHSIQDEANYLNPFDAVLSAWKLDWSIICDQFDAYNVCIQSIDLEDHTATSSLTSSFQYPNKIDLTPVFELRTSCQPHRSNLTYIRTDQNRRPRQVKHVSFHETTLIHIGLEDALQMHTSVMDTFELATWSDKPWVKKPSKKDRDKHPKSSDRQCRLKLCPSSVPLVSLRTTDAFYHVPSSWTNGDNDAPAENVEDPEDANHFLHEAPESVQNLFDALQAAGVVEGPRIHDSVFLRTWFVHHIHAPQCFHYRVVEINGHWRLWYQDIIDAWRDRIQPNHQVIFDVVHPEPPCTADNYDFLFDLIVSQGIAAPRRAGLITVLQRDDSADKASYAVAASMSEHTSGHQIVQCAEYLHGCNIFSCTIRHGHVRIPFTMEPIHEMQDGDSFTIGVPSRATSSDEPRQCLVTVSQSEQVHDFDPPNDDDDDESNVPSPSLATSRPSGDIYSGVHIHRLGHQQRHGRIRWDTIDHVLTDVGRLLNLPIDDLVAFHHLQVNPVDQTAAEESIILQHVLDVPAGSTERLVLIDIEMHLPIHPGTMPRAPPVHRQVHKVVPTIVRQHVLMISHTAGYCSWHPRDCIVFHNQQVWIQQDIAPRQIEHGAYFRVIVPPPIDPAWDIAHALRIFQEAYDLFEPPAANRIAVDILQTQYGPQQPAVRDGNHDADDFHAMQYNLDLLPLHDPPSNSSSIQSDAVVPEDWIIDLQRVVQQHVNACDSPIPEEVRFSVLTWLLDHKSQRLCRGPKLVFLGGSPEEWTDDVIWPWRNLIIPDEPVMIDLVLPTPPTSDIEDHLAHLLLTQRSLQESSVLISLDFKGVAPPDVFIRVATVLPRDCTSRDVSQATPLLAMYSRNRITWELPSLSSDEQRFRTRPGQCIKIIIHPETEFRSEATDSSDDHHNLLQYSSMVSQFRIESRYPTFVPHDTCKGADLQDDIDVPITSSRPTTRLGRRPRPLHDGTEQWFWDLGSIFSAQAVQEVLDGDSYLYVQTWFVDHHNYPHCRLPRPLRLDQCAVVWLEEFRYLWRDLLDPTVPFSVVVISPRPPQSRYQDYNCHVLLEQNRPQGRAAGVLTAMSREPQGLEVIQGAYSVPRFVRLDDLIETMNIQPQCEGRRCTAFHQQEPIHLVQATELTSGFSIRVQITTAMTQFPILPQSHSGEFDASVFMQRPASAAPQEVGDDPQQPATTPACPTFQFDPDAAAFVPGGSDLASMNEFIQDLHEIWSRAAFSWEQESPTADFISWFVDHRTWLPRCQASRRVTLSSNFADWEARILAVWHDVVDHSQSHEMFVIIPPNMEQTIAGHILVVQAPHASWVSGLVTVFDNFIGRRSQHMTRLVITTTEHIHIEHVVNSCGYDLVHGQINPQVHELVAGHPWPGRSGHEISLQVQRVVVPLPPGPAQPNPNEGLALLQTSSQRKKTLSLDELIPEELSSTDHWIPFQLLHLDFIPELPREIFLEEDATEQEVEQELQKFGHHRHAYAIGSTGKFATVPIHWHTKDHHAIYWQTNATNADDVILHTETEQMDDLSHMRFLHSCGFLRAVTTSIRTLREGLVLISFHNNEPELEGRQKKCTDPTPWPLPQRCISPQLMLDFTKVTESTPTQCMDLGVDWTYIEELFQSAPGVLCPWYSHLDLPEFVKLGIHSATTIEGQNLDPTVFDRLIIYTDGSSKSFNRRKPPLYVADTDQPDAWAFVVLGETYPKHGTPGRISFIGWQAQQIMYEDQNHAFTGTDQIGAEFAEREAMIFAGLWRLALNSTIPTVFWTDSSTTADQSMGRAGFVAAHPTISLLRGIFQALSAGMASSELEVSHVRGHAGDIWNELADHLAKSEAAIGHRLHRQPINILILRPIIPYLWMFLDRNSGLPSLTRQGFDIRPPDLPSKTGPTVASMGTPSAACCQEVSLSIASLNVGSLFLSPDGFSGKLTYLRQQMQAHRIHILGVQEARSPPGLSTADDILRISGGSDKHNLGVELWISMTMPLMRKDGKHSRLSRSNVQLLHHDPRRLIVRVSHDCLNCFLVVLHGPQSGRPHKERQTWWIETQSIISTLCQQFPLYVMIDANAKTGPVHPPIVMDNDDGISGNTPFFLEFLELFGLCLPCTSSVHQGETTTWTSPDGQSEHRIDFIAIPQAQLPSCTWSGIVPTLDQGNAHNDHTATALQLNWTVELPKRLKSTANVRHDRTKIAHKKGLLHFQHVKACDWQCNIETQVQELNSAIHTALTDVCPIDKTTPKKSFIDAETWELRASKLRLKRRISLAGKQARLDLMGLWFKQWKGETTVQEHEFVQHQCTVSCVFLKLSCQYWSCTRQLKKQLQTLKNKNMQKVIEEAGYNASAGTLLHLMKPFLGSTNPKKQKRACLPIVKQADGRICADPVEAQNRWIEFFRDMEGGRRMTDLQYRDHWLQGLDHFIQTEATNIPIQDMPTLCELETALRRVQIGKAIGMDHVPPEICHYCPVQLARLCYPIMLKAAIHGQEAAEHKGGKLAIAWKQRGDVRDCQTHRSLLVSSHIGKTIHRALRQKSHHLYDAYMQRQQLGGKQKMPVSIPLHMTRAFLRWKARISASTAVVFLDLTEAFYRTLRPLAVGGEMSDHSIGLMCARLGLDSDAMHDLTQLLQEPAALAEAQAPAHVQRMLQAFHRDTWFQIGTQTDLIRTEIGSRPGDSFADVVFGLLWAKLLRKLEAHLVSFGILEFIPDIEFPTPFASEDSSAYPRIPLLGPTWMDDLSLLITAPCNEALITKTKLAVSLLLDACHDFQMAPNLKRGKTEIMLTFRGPQSRKFRREYYSSQQGLTVICERQTVLVPVVTRYVHLGGLIHHRDVNRQEISRRLAIAHQAFQQHKRLLYRNRQLSWITRCDMFNTLILSKFLYGLESWTFTTNQSRMQIHNGIMRLYRMLLGLPHDAHITDTEVLVKTGMPDPTELLRRARLRYFGTLHNCRHHSHWGLLQEDVVWIDMLKDDLQWLWSQVGASIGLGDPVSHFPQWQDILIHHGVYWKS